MDDIKCCASCNNYDNGHYMCFHPDSPESYEQTLPGDYCGCWQEKRANKELEGENEV